MPRLRNIRMIPASEAVGVVLRHGRDFDATAAEAVRCSRCDKRVPPERLLTARSTYVHHYCSDRCKTAATSKRHRDKHKKLREFGPAEGDRYYVNEVTGWPIGGQGRSTERPSTVFTIVDDATGDMVRQFGPAGRPHKLEEIRRFATELCAEMNKDERDWEQQTGKYAPEVVDGALADAVEQEWHGDAA